jgi:hypothetical protein
MERLAKKAEEPDAPAVNRSVTAHVDLTDPKSIALAIKHGFLSADEVDDDDDDDDESKPEDKPKRPGFFGDK